MLQKNFHFCLSKLIKCFPTIQPCSESSPPPPQADIFCSHPPPLPATSSSSSAATTTTVKNFNNSLFHDFGSGTSVSLSVTPSSTDDCFFSSSDESLSDYETLPDFASLFAFPRFFCSSPGRSKSIFDQSPDARISFDYTLVTGGVKVRKYSTDPVVDFRRSMQEMIEARDQGVDIRSDWMYLQELLLCYLQMNSGNTHKFILSAFSDLVLGFLPSSPVAVSDRVQSQSEAGQHMPDSSKQGSSDVQHKITNKFE